MMKMIKMETKIMIIMVMIHLEISNSSQEFVISFLRKSNKIQFLIESKNNFIYSNLYSRKIVNGVLVATSLVSRMD